MHHPRKNDHGQVIVLAKPHSPSPLSSWEEAASSACVTPDGSMIDALHGRPFSPWQDAPTTPAAWEAMAVTCRVNEPAFEVPAGLKPAAGVVVREADSRVWLVCPSNGFGGYAATFPKGRLDGKSTQATALCEAFEESGLHVRLVRWLVDVRRSTTFTRYFLADRVGGRPSDMGWETQAVMLVPIALLKTIASHPNDSSILAALQSVMLTEPAVGSSGQP